MKLPSPILALLTVIIAIGLQIPTSNSQQQYVNNHQLNCSANYSDTNGFICNGIKRSCTSYLTFRSNPPDYATPRTISTLLNVNATVISLFNNFSDVDTNIPAGRLVVIPVSCSCASGHYQHSASYVLKAGETYFSMANNTYQGLTTCQAMIAQNPGFNIRNLTIGGNFHVPLMCACPTAKQEKQNGARYLITYLVSEGDSIYSIATMFGVDMQSVLDANELKDATIFYLTPILVPITSVPSNIDFSSAPTPVLSPPFNLPLTPTGSGGGNSSKKWVFVGVGIGVGILVLSLLMFLIWILIIRPSKKPPPTVQQKAKGGRKDPETGQYASLPDSYSSSRNTNSLSMELKGIRGAIGSVTAYKFADLEKATEKFSEANRIERSTYKGEFNGDAAAVKILKGSIAKDEINLLKHINHSNIIMLSGYCMHEGSTYLIFEFAARGSLDVLLRLSPPVIGWKQRVQIACNIADAINYLHSYTNPPYIHKNLTSSNVVLDSNFCAKITNFGLARTVKDDDENGMLHLTKHVVGTLGYLAPEYIENGVVTPKLDVFAFGVVLLELLSGKPAVNSWDNKDIGADDLLFTKIRKVFEGDNVREKLMEFMDSTLGGDYPLDLAHSMAQLAHKCVDQDMNSRPSMAEVSMMLSKICSSSMDWDPSMY